MMVALIIQEIYVIDMQKNDFRIKVFHKKNGGVSSARNVGIDNAIGDWIFFFGCR